MRIGTMMLGFFLLLPATSAAGEAERAARARVEAGLEMAPVPLRFEKRDRELVGTGSYLVNAVGACTECHSPLFAPFAEGGNPYRGEQEKIDPTRYLIGGAEIEGFVSRNLRPDNAGRPAGLTFEQFVAVMRTGKDFKPELGPPETPVLQFMTWPFYSHMTDYDLRAIYAYLSALPPVATTVDAAAEG